MQCMFLHVSYFENSPLWGENSFEILMVVLI